MKQQRESIIPYTKWARGVCVSLAFISEKLWSNKLFFSMVVTKNFQNVEWHVSNMGKIDHITSIYHVWGPAFFVFVGRCFGAFVTSRTKQ